MTVAPRERKRASIPREAVSFRTLRRDDVDRLVEAGVFLTRAHFYETAEAQLLNQFSHIIHRLETETIDR
jgi:hypothetical protein